MASVTNQVSPAVSARAITPSDGTPLTWGPCRAIYVGGAGNIVLIPANGTTAVTFTGVLAGTILPVMASSVESTLTTATNLVALY